MNKRQKKKFCKNHIALEDVRTGKKSVVKKKDFLTLLEIAGMTNCTKW